MSRASQKRNNAANTSKSVGKAQSVGANSFAQSKGSGALMGVTSKSGQVGPNIVIDIESENLTYN